MSSRLAPAVIVCMLSACTNIAIFPDKHPDGDTGTDGPDDADVDPPLDSLPDVPPDSITDSTDDPGSEPCTSEPAPILVDVRLTNNSFQSQRPSIVWTGSEYGLAWHDDIDSNFDIYFSRMSVSGTKIGSTERITTRAQISQVPSLVWNGSEYGLAWQDYRTGSREIFFCTLSGTGTMTTSELQITSGALISGPHLAWTGSEYAVAWYDARDTQRDIYFARFSASGSMIGSEVRVTDDPGDEINPTVVWSGSEYALAWKGTDIHFARFDATGSLVGTIIPVTDCSADCGSTSITWADSQFWLSWNDERDGNREIYIASVSPAGVKTSSDIRITVDADDSISPFITWTGSVLGLTWVDSRDGDGEVYFSILTSSGAETGPEVRITRTADTNQAGKPVLAWSGSQFGVAWTDHRDENSEVYFNIIDPCPY